jgi:subtilisin family serine protease
MVVAFGLTACVTIKQATFRLLQGKTVYVYEDEHVIYADGPFCPWAPGVRGCDKPYPPGIYLINDKGQVVREGLVGSLTQNGRRKVIEFNAQAQSQRGCAQLSISSQGNNSVDVACAPNFLIDKLNTPNDPYYRKLWGLSDKGIEVEKRWTKGATSSDIRISIIDTGVNCDHPDINCVAEYDAITGQEGPGAAQDTNGHGTHCAGTVAAIGNNKEGITGVTQSAQILAAKFMGANGSGSLYSAVKAIDWSVKNDAHIINASWGSPVGNSVLRKSIEKAGAAGVLFVVAAGNDHEDIDKTPQFPASYDLPNVVTVASHNKDGNVSWFSNTGKQTVELIAPGSDILSLNTRGGYKSLSGTSMATPHVAGFAALLWQPLEEQDVSRREAMGIVKAELYKSVRPEHLDSVRYGRLSANGSSSGTTPGLCKQNKCKKCLEECEERYVCKCQKQVKCRKECRKVFSCKRKCK